MYQRSRSFLTLTLCKVTQNETGSQVSDTGPLVLWVHLVLQCICIIKYVQTLFSEVVSVVVPYELSYSK